MIFIINLPSSKTNSSFKLQLLSNQFFYDYFYQIFMLKRKCLRLMSSQTENQTFGCKFSKASNLLFCLVFPSPQREAATVYITCIYIIVQDT